MSNWGEKKQYETCICTRCSIEFGVPFGFIDNRRSDKNTFHCPNGHAMSYSESTEDKLRRERDRLKQQMAQRDDEIASERRRREAAEVDLAKRSKQVTKLRKRAAAGTCPCCRRTFSDMSEHMKRQHPEFVEATGANVVPLNGLGTALNARAATKATP